MANSEDPVQKLVLAVNMFVKKDGKYLMMHRSKDKKYYPDYYQTIGGKVEIDEEPLDAAFRELKEEAGIDIKNIKLEAVFTHIYKPYNWLIFYFSSDYVSGDLISSDEGELEWLSENDLKKVKLTEPVSFLLNSLINSEVGPVFAKFIHDEDYTTILDKSYRICSL